MSAYTAYLRNCLQKERDTERYKCVDYLELLHIDKSYYAKMLTWIKGTVEDHCFHSSTVFLSKAIMEEYLSKMKSARVDKDLFQLVGVTSFYIACKLNESDMVQLTIGYLTELCDDRFDKEHILRMEKLILKVLDMKVNLATEETFLEICHVYLERLNVNNDAKFDKMIKSVIAKHLLLTKKDC